MEGAVRGGEFRALVGVEDVAARLEVIGDECELIAPVAPGPLEPEPDDPVSWPLRAKNQLVGFVEEGRRDVLGGLRDWCHGPAMRSVRLITGPAGVGKSRLVMELCRRLRYEAEADGWWHAGLAVNNAETAGAWSRFDPRRDTLIVFDYADDPQWIEPFRALYTRVRELSRDRLLAARVRILLISRHRNDWLIHLDRGTDGALTAALDLPGCEDIALDEVPFTHEIRRAHLETAFTAFTSREAITGGTAPRRPNILDDAYDRPLLVHIAALLGAKGEHTPMPGSGQIRDRLLDLLLDRERARWEILVAANDAHRQQAVCIATLTSPTVPEARELLRAAPVWRAKPDDVRDDTARRPHDLYPDVKGTSGPLAQRRIAPVEPDLIAEHLVATTDELPEVLAELQTSENPEHHARTLQLMTLAADNHPAVDDLYRQELADRLGRLIDLEGNAPRALPQLLAKCLPKLVEVAVERALRGDVIPYPSYRLQRSTDIREELVKTDRDAHLPALARSLYSLARRLHAVERRTEGLTSHVT